MSFNCRRVVSERPARARECRVTRLACNLTTARARSRTGGRRTFANVKPKPFFLRDGPKDYCRGNFRFRSGKQCRTPKDRSSWRYPRLPKSSLRMGRDRSPLFRTHTRLRRSQGHHGVQIFRFEPEAHGRQPGLQVRALGTRPVAEPIAASLSSRRRSNGTLLACRARPARRRSSRASSVHRSRPHERR